MVKKAINLYNYIVDMSKYYLQSGIERYYKNKKDNKYTLMFHCVSNNKNNWDEDEYSISMDSFKLLIQNLEEKRYIFSDPKSFLKKGNQKRILLTFDDAFKTVYEEVFPYLVAKNYPFIVFQTVKNLENDKFLNRDMIKEMSKYNEFYLGTHTIDHVEMHKCKDYKEQIKNPIDQYDKIFGIKPKYFAFPYGAFITIDLKTIFYVKKNYDAAFSTCNTGCNQFRFKYLLPRVNINEENFKKILETMG